MAVALATVAPRDARGDGSPQPLPLLQDWSTSPVVVDDDWSTVPGIVGYSGAGLIGNNIGTPPSEITEPGGDDSVPLVEADRATALTSAGGIVELVIDDPIIAMSGSSQVDAPHLVVTVDTSAVARVHVSYVVVDLDRTGNVEQALALQYRVGTAGPFTNVPEAYVADATAGPNQAGLRTRVAVDLPDEAAGQPVLQLRLITANAQGGDEWIGIDNLRVVAGHPPTAAATITPAPAGRRVDVQLLATVTPGVSPPSTALVVGCDASALGADALLRLWDDGAHGDGAAGDLVFGVARTVPDDLADGVYPLACRVRDAQGRITPFEVALEVAPWCGNGLIDPPETCEDGDTTPGDGCDAACAIEPGWQCSPEVPATCTDVDECASSSDECVAEAACVNTTGGYGCACPDGFAGDGRAFGTGCADVDECALGLDDCVDRATCTNLPGAFACSCAPGWSGDGRAGGSGCADVDECAAMTDDCAPEATCTDVDGAWACACLPGYAGDGVTCAAVCGDGLVVDGEGCDDADDRDDGAGDGCAACAVEAGWACEGAPSACAPVCGDGLVVADEACDVETPDPPREGGGCAAGGGAATGGAGLLAALALTAGWYRPRRRGRTARPRRPGAAPAGPRA